MIAAYRTYRTILENKYERHHINLPRLQFLMDKLMEWDLAPEWEMKADVPQIIRELTKEEQDHLNKILEVMQAR